MKKLNNKAFTIIELLIASMVFTSLLMLCMEGITRIVKAYVKNASISQTSEFIKSLSDEITQQVKFGSSAPAYSVSDNVTKMCISGKAYRVELNVKEPYAVQKKADQLCQSYTGDSFFLAADVEKLAPSGMRVLDFNLSESGNIWSVDIKVALGDADLLEDASGVSLTNVNADYKTAKCKPGAGSEYCAVMSLTTKVSRRMVSE